MLRSTGLPLEKHNIRKGTKIDNLVQIAHNVTVGENSIIVAQVGIAGSATIGNNVILAGQTGVRDHVTVGNNVKAGGRTGITKDVPDNTLIMGTPHMPFKEWAKLQGYFRLLPQLFAKVKTDGKKTPSERLIMIDINEIMQLLPHRYPFLLVDQGVGI